MQWDHDSFPQLFCWASLVLDLSIALVIASRKLYSAKHCMNDNCCHPRLPITNKISFWTHKYFLSKLYSCIHSRGEHFWATLSYHTVEMFFTYAITMFLTANLDSENPPWNTCVHMNGMIGYIKLIFHTLVISFISHFSIRLY